MKHAREDYKSIQECTGAVKLAKLVLENLPFTPENGAMRSLAHGILNHVGELPEGQKLIPADEPVFLIRGQDETGGDTVRDWVKRNEVNGASPELLDLAREHAKLMDNWPHKKVADIQSKVKE